MDIDTPVEDKLSKIDEIVHGLKVKVEELELQIKLSTPPEELQQREKVTETFESFKYLQGLDTECSRLYKVGLYIWNKLQDNVELKEFGTKIQTAQQRSESICSSFTTLPLSKHKLAMVESVAIGKKINQLKEY